MLESGVVWLRCSASLAPVGDGAKAAEPADSARSSAQRSICTRIGVNCVRIPARCHSGFDSGSAATTSTCGAWTTSPPRPSSARSTAGPSCAASWSRSATRSASRSRRARGRSTSRSRACRRRTSAATARRCFRSRCQARAPPVRPPVPVQGSTVRRHTGIGFGTEPRTIMLTLGVPPTRASPRVPRPVSPLAHRRRAPSSSGRTTCSASRAPTAAPARRVRSR